MKKRKITAGAAMCALAILTVSGTITEAEEYEAFSEESGIPVLEEESQVSTDSSVSDWEENTGTEQQNNDLNNEVQAESGTEYWEESEQSESIVPDTNGSDAWQETTETNGTVDYIPESYPQQGGEAGSNGEQIYWEEETLETVKEEVSGSLYRQSEESLLPDDYEIMGREEAIKAFRLSSLLEIPAEIELDVPEILQKPLLPTGCESVSLTMALQYEGFDVDKEVIARDYLIYNHETDNMAIGYIGDPFSEEGAGCFAPALVMTAQEFFLDQKAEYDVYDVTGSELEELLEYVSLGTPVILWSTMYMEEPEFTNDECEFNGHVYRWYRQEHCVVLSGYDLEEGTLQINDPLEGIVTRDLEEFEQIFVKTGKNAVVMKEKDSEDESEEEMSIQEMYLAGQAAQSCDSENVMP